MKRLLLSTTFLACFAAPALAQQSTACVGVGGINTVPIPGVICPSEPTVPTYAATGVAMVPAGSATDLACLSGAANVVVRVQAIRVSGSAGTLITLPILIMKHASLDTGGTPNTGTALPVPYALDSSNAAPKASTTSYSANPTINDASPGIIDSSELSLVTTSANVTPGFANFDYSERNYSQAPLLRTAAQQICVNLNSTSPSSGSMQVSFKWTEASQ